MTPTDDKHTARDDAEQERRLCERLGLMTGPYYWCDCVRGPVEVVEVEGERACGHCGSLDFEVRRKPLDLRMPAGAARLRAALALRGIQCDLATVGLRRHESEAAFWGNYDKHPYVGGTIVLINARNPTTRPYPRIIQRWNSKGRYNLPRTEAAALLPLALKALDAGWLVGDTRHETDAAAGGSREGERNGQ